jgi:RNA polymerase sigma-70 factor (ECF subfamily)
MQTALDLRNELEDLKNDSSSAPAMPSPPAGAGPARELVERYRATCNPVHLVALFERYAHLALGVSLRYLRNREDAEDAVMEVYEHLLTALLKHEVANFESWLFSVVANQCRMTLRRRKGAPTTVEAEELLDAVLATASVPTDHDETERERRAVPAALAHLGEGQRRCLELFYLQGHSYAEVARRSGYPLHEVKSHIQNGKRNLKAFLTARPE